MNREEVYIAHVLDRLPAGSLRRQIEMDLRSHIADRLERGSSIEEAIRQLGDPTALAESYLAAVPLVSAPLGRRAVAKAIDLLLCVAIPLMVLILGLPSGIASGLSGEPLDHPYFVVATALAILAIPASLLYIIVAEHRTGQTLGKRLLGLQVVTESGARISMGQSFLRQLPLFLQIFVVDALFALFTEKKQRAFELITKTRVVVARGAERGDALAERAQGSPGAPPASTEV